MINYQIKTSRETFQNFEKCENQTFQKGQFRMMYLWKVIGRVALFQVSLWLQLQCSLAFHAWSLLLEVLLISVNNQWLLYITQICLWTLLRHQSKQNISWNQFLIKRSLFEVKTILQTVAWFKINNQWLSSPCLYHQKIKTYSKSESSKFNNRSSQLNTKSNKLRSLQEEKCLESSSHSTLILFKMIKNSRNL